MFNFLSKKNNNKESNSLLADFQNSLNKQQKAAILTSLSIVSTSKGKSHDKDAAFYIQTCNMLGVKLGDTSVTEMQSKSEQDLIDVLKTLDEGQKDWFIVALHSMASADGKVEFSEMAVAIDICNRIGISDDRYIKTLEKTKALMNRA